MPEHRLNQLLIRLSAMLVLQSEYQSSYLLHQKDQPGEQQTPIQNYREYPLLPEPCIFERLQHNKFVPLCYPQVRYQAIE